MKKRIFTLALTVFLLFALTLSVTAAENKENFCTFSDDMQTLFYNGNAYMLFEDNLSYVDSEMVELYDEFDDTELCTYRSADYVITVSRSYGILSNVEHYVRVDRYDEVKNIANEHNAVVYDLAGCKLLAQNIISWKSDAVKYDVKVSDIDFDESFLLDVSGGDFLVWCTVGEVIKEEMLDGEYRYYLLKYNECGEDYFLYDGSFDYESNKTVTLWELTDEELISRINEVTAAYSEEDSIMLFGPLSDTAIAIVFGIFFAVIPLVIAAVCLAALLRRVKNPYLKLYKIIIAVSLTVVLCYFAVLLILML